MIIQHNMTAANTNRQLGITTGNLQKSTEKLSSGYRINRAGDDAAGLAISEKMRGQIRGLEQASTNAQDAISMIQTAEGAMNEQHAILQRMRELAVQSSNDTNTDTDRSFLDQEVKQLQKELTRIGSQTEFNEKKLLDGSQATDALEFQVGANENQKITVTIDSCTAEKMGAQGVDVSSGAVKIATRGDADSAITTINNAIKSLSETRSKLGAVQNRLEHTIANTDNTAENLQAAESRIRDVDMASEMVKFSKNNILQQAAQSMLAQANQSQQGVLSLLR